MNLPRLLSRARAFTRTLLRRADVDRDLDDELRSFVGLLERDNVAQGMAPAEARRRALIEAGGVTQVKEHVRDARAAGAFDRVARDVRHALRGMSRSPGFTAAVVATLAVGIGFNSATFTLAYAVLARPLPVRDADRVVNVYQQLHRGGPFGREVRGAASYVSYPEFQAYAQAPAFESAAVYAPIDVTVSGDTPRTIPSELVSCGYFRTLRVHLTVGRDFSDDECASVGTGPSVVLSHATWTSVYGSDPAVVGRVIDVNGIQLRIVGIAEPAFDGASLNRAGMWIPVTMQPALAHGRDSILVRANASWLVMAARLAPTASLDDARAQTSVIAARLDAETPGRLIDSYVARGAYINFPDVGSEKGLPLALVMLLGLTIIAMACANVMNLLLARGLARRREIAIRLALGASRRQLIRQLLIESGMLTLLGATIGLGLILLLRPAVAASAPAGHAIQLNVAPDLRVIGYVFLVAVASTFMFGLLPALQTTTLDLASAFKGAGLFSHGLRPSRFRSAIVGVQMTGSAMLLVIAALFLRGATHALSVDPGYRTHGIVSFATNASSLGYDSTRAVRVVADLAATARAAVGVSGVGAVNHLPLLGRSTTDVVGRNGADSIAVNSNTASASPAYFDVMGIRILRGRLFDSSDATAPERAVVISGSLAERLWPGGSAIGQRVRSGKRYFRVVGITSEISASSLSQQHDPMIYFPAADPTQDLIVVRIDGNAATLVPAMLARAREIDPQLIVTAQSFEDRIALALLPARMIAGATAALGTLALLMASIGIGGVVGFGVRQRQREVAVRIAIGATAAQVVALMMRQGMRPLLGGTVVGLTLGAIVGVVLRSLLSGVSPLDPIAFAAIIAILGVSGALATYLPSRRAASLDPALVLRQDD